MPVRIQKGDLIIEVSTESELGMVLRVLGAGQLALPLTNPPITAPKTESNAEIHAPEVTTAEKVARFLRYIHKPRQSLLLENLARNQTGMTDAQLRQALSLATNLSLSGVLTALYKNAKKAGLRSNQVMTKERSGAVGKRVYRYTLTRQVREAMGVIGQTPHTGDPSRPAPVTGA